MALPSGTNVGPYVIQEHLASGGMGEVYRARDPRLARDVAVKVLAGTEVPNPDLLRRFEQEARATAALNHANILTVFDVGTHESQPFLVCELLEGKTLREQLESGPLDSSRVLRLAVQLARGVAAAHALKIVHRDLKPENPLGPDAATLNASMPGQLIGTMAYMAPEQVRGEPVDERADIFAIGVILHEMLSGRSPFRQKSGPETLDAILREPPAPLESEAAPPPGLERLVLRCLEKEPSERFQTATDLAFAIEEVLGNLTQPLSAALPPQSTSVGVSIAVLPFADMSPTRDQDHLCEGIAEELINALTHVDGLRVAARSSSFQFRGSAVDIRAVGARLGVSSVLEGSVRKSGNRLRVAVQLVDVTDGYDRWSQRFDGSLEDVFAIEDEIAESVATALRGVLSAREKDALRRPETDVEAYDYFLRGRQLVNRVDRASLEMSRQMFEHALERDPEYAPAWAGLADVHSWFYEWWGSQEPDLEAADAASSKALALAPDLSESHASRGFVLSSRGLYKEAEKEFVEALRLNPHSYDALYYYARTCFASGRIERSAELFRRAAEARREDYQAPILLAQSLTKLGQREEAREANQEGIRRAERQLELNPTDARALSLGANGLMLDGQRERALVWSGRALELKPDDQSVLMNGACLRAVAGLKDEALDLLERCFTRGWGKRDWVEHDPDFDSIRDHPRFQALLAQLRQ